MIAIRNRLQVLVAVAADRHDHVHDPAAGLHEELVLTCLDTLDGVLLAEFPGRSVRINPADRSNALVGVIPIAFIDTFDFVSRGHFYYPFQVIKVPRSGPEKPFLDVN